MIIDMGFGYMMKPHTFKSERERQQHQVKRQQQERAMCEMYGFDYDDVLLKRGEENLIKELSEVI